MSANTNLHPTHHETSGESVFFAMALAFLAVVLVLVGIFFARVLGEG